MKAFGAIARHNDVGLTVPCKFKIHARYALSWGAISDTLILQTPGSYSAALRGKERCYGSR
jgi:hypothetical protein